MLGATGGKTRRMILTKVRHRTPEISMPPVNQQGSKAGLITSLIIAVILLMVAVIMTITTNTDLTKTRTELTKLTQKYNEVARADQITSDETSERSLLLAAKEKLNLEGNPTAVEVAVAEIKRLTGLINNKPSTTFADAESDAVNAVMSALKFMKSPATASPTTAPAGSGMPGGESLITAMTKLQSQLKSAADTNAAQKKELENINTGLGTRATGWTAQLDEMNKKVADADKRAADAEAAKTAIQAQYTTKQTAADTSNKDTVESTGKQLTEMQQALAQAKAETAKANKDIESLRGQLAKYRNNVKDAAVRQADGTLIHVPSSTVCYISLGSGDHLPAGTTFEVYDKSEGIPGLGADPLGNTNLPIGKASIEVIRVGQNSSECRIVHLQPGATLAEGDLIANLIYDRNTTLNFFVYGNFDVDGNNVWTAQEADVVKSLVTRWGGKLSEQIGVSTDFVVLGQEPQVPVFTKEELLEPVNKDKFDKAVIALNKYQDVINQAATLHIPIMNQNRFMYYIGYYDLLKR